VGKKEQTIMMVLWNILAGCDGNTICVRAGVILYSYCVLDDGIPVDSSQVLMVLLHFFLLIPLLHLLWDDDRLYLSQP
jgi:hypothetical protein